MKIAILPGDGIGTEIVAQAERVLGVLDLEGSRPSTPWSAAPPTKRAAIRCRKRRSRSRKAADAVLFGADGDWKYDKLERALRPEQAILGLRKHLGCSPTCARRAPIRSSSRSSSAQARSSSAGLDILIVRELTGDIYFGQPRGRRGTRRRVHRRARSL